MKAIPTLLIAGLLLSAAGCGSDDETPAAGTRQSTDAALENKDLDNADTNPDAKNAVTTKHDEDLSGAKRDGTEITLDESQFGTMLFNSKKQAIYVFEQDSKGKSVCYGECARAWPPVLTDGDPLARKGVQASLLGTAKRRDRRGRESTWTVMGASRGEPGILGEGIRQAMLRDPTYGPALLAAEQMVL